MRTLLLQRRWLLNSTGICFVAMSMTLSPGAMAQETAAAPTQVVRSDDNIDIVVTARRRDESLQDVPVAVSVITSTQLVERTIIEPKDIATVSPGLEANTTGGGRSPNFAIRGQGTNYGAGGSGVATYLGEVPDFGNQIFDLDNIQVLKGPQGTLFGRVTTGGAVLLKAAEPTEALTGYVRVRAGSRNRRELDFAGSTAIVPGVLALRISGVTRNNSGFTYNLFDRQHSDSQDRQALRAIATLNLGIVENTLLYQYEHSNDGARGILIRGASAQGAANSSGNNRPIPITVANASGISCVGGCPTWLAVMQQQVSDQNARGVQVFDSNGTGESAESEFQGVINRTKIDASDTLTFRNIFSYRQDKLLKGGPGDQDGSKLPVVELGGPASSGTRYITEELQLQAKFFDALQLTMGGFYQKTWQPAYQRSVNNLYGGYLSSSALIPQAGCAAPNVYSDGFCHFYTGDTTRRSKQSGNDKAGYAQGVLAVTDKLNLTAGIRYTDISRTTYSAPTMTSVSLLAPGAPASELLQIPGTIPALIPVEQRTIAGVVPTVLTAARTTYTLAADYQIKPNVLLYFTMRSGYKPGGFNASAPVGLQQYGAETVTDYEAGVKSTFRIGGVAGRFNIDAFWDDYSDIQRVQIGNLNNMPVSFTANVAAARIRGLDIDMALRFSRAFDVSAFYTYTDAKYLRWPNTGQVPGVPITADLTKNMVANVSPHRFGMTASYNLIGLSGDNPDISLSGNVYYQSRYAFSDNNVVGSPSNITDGRTLFNLRLNWRKVANSPVSLAVAAINLTNNQSLIGGVDGRQFGGYISGIYYEPRSVFVEASLNF